MDQLKAWGDLGRWLMDTGLTPKQIKKAVTKFLTDEAMAEAVREADDLKQMKLPFDGKQ